MSTTIEICEPLKSYLAKLDAFELTAENGEIKQSGYMCSHLRLPELDPEDARSLAAELNEVVLPIIKRFRARKLRELTGYDSDQPAEAKRSGFLGMIRL